MQTKTTRRRSVWKNEDTLVEAAVGVSSVGRVKHVFWLDRAADSGGSNFRHSTLRYFVYLSFNTEPDLTYPGIPVDLALALLKMSATN